VNAFFLRNNAKLYEVSIEGNNGVENGLAPPEGHQAVWQQGCALGQFGNMWV
jgi:hypothetical protein